MCSAGACANVPPGYFSAGGRDPVACTDYTYAVAGASTVCTPCLPLQPITGVVNPLEGYVCPGSFSYAPFHIDS